MPQAKITIIGGDLDGTEFNLKGGDNRIGRVSDNDIVLRDRSISRRHAMIKGKDGQFTIEDLGSHNGIEVNGTKVQQCPLMHGLQFKLGDFQVVFLDGSTSNQLSSGSKNKSLAKSDQKESKSGNWEELFEAAPDTVNSEPDEEDAVDAQKAGNIEEMDLFGEAQQEISLDRPEDTFLSRLGLVIYIALLVGTVCLGFYLLHQQTEQGLWEPTEDYVMKKGEVRVFNFRNRFTDIVIPGEGEQVVHAELMKFNAQNENEPQLFIKVKALGPGMASIVGKPAYEEIRIVVQGRIAQTEEPEKLRRMPEEQRLHQGRLLIRSGKSHYIRMEYAAAWQDFNKAEKLLRPFRVSADDAYQDAQQRLLETETKLDSEIKRLKNEYLTAKENTDPEIANRILERILLLLPDRDDPQHQITRKILKIRRSR